MAPVMLLEASTMQFLQLRSVSSCVSSEFTARTASLGSPPPAAALLTAARLSTSSTSTKTSASGC